LIWRRAHALIAAHDGRHEEAAELSGQALELVRATDVLVAPGEVL